MRLGSDLQARLDAGAYEGYGWKHQSAEVEKAMNATDKRKQSLYFPREMLAEISAEARRQDRSLSWIVQQAWKIARERFKSVSASPPTSRK